MIYLLIALLLSSPLSQDDIDAMNRKAAGHIFVVREAVKEIKENCPNVPQLYFDAMEADLSKIEQDKDVTAPTFRQDFDDLDADFHSLLGAIPVYRDMAKI